MVGKYLSFLFHCGVIDKITNNGAKKLEKVNIKNKIITDFAEAAAIARTYKIVIFLDPGITTPLCGIAIDPNGLESQLWNPFPRSSRLLIHVEEWKFQESKC